MGDVSDEAWERALASGAWAPDRTEAWVKDDLATAGRQFFVGAVVAGVTRAPIWLFSWGLVGMVLGGGYQPVSRVFGQADLLDFGGALALLLAALVCAVRLRAGSRRAVRAGRVLAWIYVADNLWCVAWLGWFAGTVEDLDRAGVVFFGVLLISYAILLVVAVRILRRLGRPVVREWLTTCEDGRRDDNDVDHGRTDRSRVEQGRCAGAAGDPG